MPSHRVTKQITFCYGHRLLNYDGKCKHLHGHNGLLEVDVVAPSLDERGMVVDFSDVKEAVKGWVDENLDHRMILCQDDPYVAMLQERGEPLYLMPENPTAENIARHVFAAAKRSGLTPTEVRLWETASSYAAYSEE